MDGAAIKSLCLLFLNAENLFLAPIKQSQFSFSLKEEKKVEWMASTILKARPDIISLCEVGGQESLEVFNKKYLNDLYTPFMILGNSNRGIHVGHLIKKSTLLSGKIISHKTRNLSLSFPGDKKETRYQFSRDVSELRLFKNPADKIPFLILLGVHLKSKLDKEGKDWQGRKRRAAELSALLDIYEENKKKFPEVSQIICGDFNGEIRPIGGDSEFQMIYRRTELRDFLDWIDWPIDQRSTFMAFDKQKKQLPMQLDYFLLGPKLASSIDSLNTGIIRYQNASGELLAFPKSPAERYTLPSDHYPLLLTLKF